MTAWMVWLIVAGVLAVCETTSMTFVLLMFSLGALVAAGAAGLGANDALQVVVFIIASVALLALVRPVVRKHLQRPGLRTNADALIGMGAITLSEVDARQGRVRLDNKAEWTAQAVPGVVIPAGAAVQVVQISGATAVVRPQSMTSDGLGT